MDKERLIRIKWDGPYDLEQAKCLSGKEDYGMYQIYGRHVIFGKDSLLKKKIRSFQPSVVLFDGIYT